MICSFMAPAKTSKKQGFQPGKSGNPKGRPAGSRNKASLAIDALLDGEAEALTRKCIDKALWGDNCALKLCMDRIWPPRKDKPVQFKLPEMSEANDASGAMKGLLKAVSAGDLTPLEGATVAALIETYRKTLETTELEERIVALEAR